MHLISLLIHDVTVVQCFIIHTPVFCLRASFLPATPTMPHKQSQQTNDFSKLGKKALESLLLTREAQYQQLAKKLGE